MKATEKSCSNFELFYNIFRFLRKSVANFKNTTGYIKKPIFRPPPKETSVHHVHHKVSLPCWFILLDNHTVWLSVHMNYKMRDISQKYPEIQWFCFGVWQFFISNQQNFLGWLTKDGLDWEFLNFLLFVGNLIDQNYLIGTRRTISGNVPYAW